MLANKLLALTPGCSMRVGCRSLSETLVCQAMVSRPTGTTSTVMATHMGMDMDIIIAMVTAIMDRKLIQRLKIDHRYLTTLMQGHRDDIGSRRTQCFQSKTL